MGAVLRDATAETPDARAHCDRVIPEVRDARAYLERLVGVGLSHGIELIVLQDPINAREHVPAQSTAVRAGTVGCYPHGTFDRDPDCSGLPADGALNTGDWHCQIQISGDFADVNHAVQRSALAHELFHCYQREWSGQTVQAFFGSMPWLIEGSAAWVGETYAHGSDISHQWWLGEVGGNGEGPAEDACPGRGSGGPPFACVFGRPRGYSAHSFFFALARERGDAAVVSAVHQAISIGGSDSIAMDTLAPASDPVWLQWAGYARDWSPGGENWRLSAPGNNAAPRRRWHRSLSLASGPQVSVTAAPTENKIADVSWNEIRTGEQNMVVELNGNAMLRWLNGDDRPVGPDVNLNGSNERITVCITPRCRGDVERPPHGAQSLVVAVAGNGSSPSGATVAVECPAPNQSPATHISALGPPGGVSRCCLVGTWTMSQAPQYRNFQTQSGGTGAVLTVDPDGHLTEDFSGMSEWVVQRSGGSADSGTVHLKLDGTLTADVDLDKLVNQRRAHVSATDWSGVLVTASVDIAHGRLDFGTQPFQTWWSIITGIAGTPPDENPVNLTCNASTMTLTDSTSGITHVFTRTSEPVCGGSSCDTRGGSA